MKHFLGILLITGLFAGVSSLRTAMQLYPQQASFLSLGLSVILSNSVPPLMHVPLNGVIELLIIVKGVLRYSLK